MQSRWSSGYSIEQLQEAENLLNASQSSQPGDERRIVYAIFVRHHR